jgi:preprotein translocase subunit SecG
MASMPVLAVNFVMNLVGILFVISAVVLILVILVQKGRGGGLSSAFGGGASGGVLGTKTGDFLTWVTIGLVAAWLLLSVVMAKYYKPSVTGVGNAPGAGAPSGQTQPEQSTAPPPSTGDDSDSEETPAEFNSPGTM